MNRKKLSVLAIVATGLSIAGVVLARHALKDRRGNYGQRVRKTAHSLGSGVLNALAKVETPGTLMTKENVRERMFRR